MTSVSASDFVFALDLIGIFVFAVDGALVAARNADLDLIGWVVVGVVTAAGGGILRDLLIGAVPPAMFVQWYYLADALAGSLLAFFLAGLPRMLAKPLLILDAVGISLFCVTGAQKALVYGLEPPAAVIMGALTAVGGGTIRDIIVRQVPTVLTPGGLYAIPALIGATIAVVGFQSAVFGVPFALIGAISCFSIRMLGVTLKLNAPRPPRLR